MFPVFFFSSVDVDDDDEKSGCRLQGGTEGATGRLSGVAEAAEQHRE